jgi:demethylspheroidene O-methyltransferase
MGFQDQWRRWRNRMIASPRFQAFAADFALTRPIARARSKALFDLIAGFTYSQTLAACLELGLFEKLAEAPASLESLAKELGFEPKNLERLLKAAVSLDLLEKSSSGTYDLGIHGAALRGNPYIAGFIRHHALLYADLLDPVALVRGGRETALSRYWAYAGDGENSPASRKAVADYTELMAASQKAVAREILALHDFSDASQLLDVGGSNGTFIASAATRYPHLHFTLFDLPAVTEIAQESFEKQGISGRTQIAPGSFLKDPLPQGADVATLIRVLHDHDDDSALVILTGIRKALPPKGRLVLAEPLSGAPDTAPIADAYFGLYFAAMGQGKTRNAEEIAQLGRKAGFTRISSPISRMPLITSVMVLEH